MDNNQTLNTEKLLATGKVGSLIARYAIPGAVGLVFFSLQSIVDGIIVGNFVGADALASVSLVVPAYTMLTAIALIVGIGSQAQMSISIGQRDYAKAKSALKTGLIFIVAFAAVFSVFINMFPEQVAGFLGSEGVLLQGSVGYISGVMPFMIAIACFYFFDYVLKALGHPRFSMIVMVSAVLLNIGLSILFVTSFELGTFGVGLATGISMLMGCILSGFVAWKQLRTNSNLNRKKGHFSWRLLFRIFYNGSSEGVSEIAMGITLFLFNLTLMESAGKEGVAAFSVINYIIFIGTSILLGISDGTIPVVSFNFGAKLWSRIQEAVKVVIRVNFLIGIVFLILLWTCGEYIISLFLDSSSQAVIDMAVQGSRIMGFAFLLNGFNIFSASFFTAIDNAKWSLIIASLRGIVFIVIGITIFPQIIGIDGIWITIPVAELLTALIGGTILRLSIKRKQHGQQLNNKELAKQEKRKIVSDHAMSR